MNIKKHTIIILALIGMIIIKQWQFDHQKQLMIQTMTTMEQEQELVYDSLHTYIKEMGTALDLFTGGKPMVFTAYNATVGQCDDTPNITASNKEIFPGVLALSRELLKPYGHGGNIAYGDTVWVVMPMQVEDTMNKRWRKRGDIYMLDYNQAIQFGKRTGHLYSDAFIKETKLITAKM